MQIAFAIWAGRRRDRTGRDAPVWPVGIGLLVRAADRRAHRRDARSRRGTFPALRGFNYRGGFVLVPEFVALFAALTTYTAAFIAEIVRGGILAVPEGTDRGGRAPSACGRASVLRLVVIPQALRVIIPPMTSQYLNVLKNSSFGAAIAYPELVSVFMGSALNNTGQAIEIIAITLGVYLDARPRGLGADELVQRPHGAGDAMTRALETIRAKLFATPLDAVITLAVAFLLWRILVPLVDWMLLDANFSRHDARRLHGAGRLLGVHPRPLRPVHVRALSAEPSAGASISRAASSCVTGRRPVLEAACPHAAPSRSPR